MKIKINALPINRVKELVKIAFEKGKSDTADYLFNEWFERVFKEGKQ
jgi:hypothetical protein